MKTEKPQPAWGPLTGAVTPVEPKIIVVNHATLAKDSQIALTTGKPLRVGDATRLAKVVTNSSASTSQEAQPLEVASSSENPFHHPPAKFPLPEILPKFSKVQGVPLADKLNHESAEQALQRLNAQKKKPTTGRTLPPVVAIPTPAPILQGWVPPSKNAPAQAAPSAPQAIARVAPVVPSVPVVPPTVQTQPNTSGLPAAAESPADPSRGRLSNPQTATVPSGTISNIPVEQVPAALTGRTGAANDQFSHYKFSFSHEIWLLIFILGGVFATLWFRLEYDFGHRSRRRR